MTILLFIFTGISQNHSKKANVVKGEALSKACGLIVNGIGERVVLPKQNYTPYVGSLYDHSLENLRDAYAEYIKKAGKK